VCPLGKWGARRSSPPPPPGSLLSSGSPDPSARAPALTNVLPTTGGALYNSILSNPLTGAVGSHHAAARHALTHEGACRPRDPRVTRAIAGVSSRLAIIVAIPPARREGRRGEGGEPLRSLALVLLCRILQRPRHRNSRQNPRAQLSGILSLSFSLSLSLSLFGEFRFVALR